MSVTAVELDFETKVERTIGLGEARGAMAAGRFVWLDVDFASSTDARADVGALGLCNQAILDDALTREPATQMARYDDYLHLVLTGCRLVGEKFALERVDAVIGERFLLTLHRGQPVFLDGVKRSYRQDFKAFARSPSFLVYELWDHLIENYLEVQKRFEEKVEKIQAALIGEVDDTVFAQVSEVGGDLLQLRKVVLPARSVLSELSSRKSLFISEATQPFLANMVGTLERVLQDLLVDRDIVSDSLNLHMSIVSHRTNAVMKRLAAWSIMFLPLTFICGVYGMNFEILPETKWAHGYLFFWGLVATIAGFLYYLLKRIKLL